MPLCVEKTINTKRSKDLYGGMIQEIRQKQKDDWDAIIVITGPEGCGKSSLAINMAHDLDSDVLTNLKDHVVWSGEDLNKLVFTKQPSAIVEDESGLDFFSREAMGKSSKNLIKMVMVMRAQNHIPILVLPNIKWLDTYLREHRVNLWIKVWTVKEDLKEERGFADVFTAVRGDFQKNTYWQKQFSFRFPDFPYSIEREYKRLKKASMMERMVGDPIEERSRWIYNAYKMGITQAKIGDIFELTQQRISQTIKDTKVLLEDTGIKK